MKKYKEHGISFSYPENWELEENEFEEDGAEEGEDTQGSVTLTTPGGEFWVLMVKPAGYDPYKLAKEAIDTMSQEYRDIEIHPVNRELEGVTLNGYEMNFYFLDLTHTAMILAFEWNDKTYAIFWQTGDLLVIRPDEPEFSVDEVFEAVTISLLRGFKTSSKPGTSRK
ncbi:MAG: hypothetical protein ACRC2T_08490 [Thermoguttaceae bacterium]